MYNSEKINDFIKQASSMHVLNTVYFVGLLIATLYSLSLSVISFNVNSPMLMTTILLFLTFSFKVFIQLIPPTQKTISDEEIELLLASFNVLATYFLLKDLKFINGVEGEYYGLLISFIPTLLFILISPISWAKKVDVSYYGFFGFLEWSLLLGVAFFSLTMFWQFLTESKWLSLTSNGVVLASPFLLSMMRKRHMDGLKERLYVEIYQDPLTKISNRKCFYDYYDKVREQNKKLGLSPNSMVIFFVDIDHFKQYNDFYGHEKGDECLVAVASFINDVANEHGLDCYRYGGEEFILCGTKSKDEFESLLETDFMKSWLKGDMTLPLQHEKSKKGVVTLSAGATFVDSSTIYESNAGEITKVADQYLYKAKDDGRSVLKVAR